MRGRRRAMTERVTFSVISFCPNHSAGNIWVRVADLDCLAFLILQRKMAFTFFLGKNCHFYHFQDYRNILKTLHTMNDRHMWINVAKKT